MRAILFVSLLASVAILTAQVKPEEPRPVALDTASYQIGPKDLLQIDVWGHPDISRLHRVRPDGKITVAYVGDAMAGGVTPQRLGVHVAEALKSGDQRPKRGRQRY